jgi:hypothetical protein
MMGTDFWIPLDNWIRGFSSVSLGFPSLKNWQEFIDHILLDGTQWHRLNIDGVCKFFVS